MVRSLLLFIGLLSLSFCSEAFAKSLAFIELHFSNIPPGLEEQLRLQMEESLTEMGYRIQPQKKIDSKIREIGIQPGCTIGLCLARLGRTLHTERAITGTIGSHGSSYEMIINLLETGGGTLLAQVNRRCDVCTFKEVVALTGQIMAQLHREALIYISTQASLTIQSEPSNAEVLLNGLLAGSTPLLRILPPGPYRLEVRAPGVGSAQKTLRLETGKSHQLKINLLQNQILNFNLSSHSPGPPSRFYHSPWLTWTSLGAGIVMSVVGSSLWALDGQETSDPRYVYNTRAGGVTLVGLGITAITSAVVLYLVQKQHRQTHSAETTLPTAPPPSPTTKGRGRYKLMHVPIHAPIQNER